MIIIVVKDLTDDEWPLKLSEPGLIQNRKPHLYEVIGSVEYSAVEDGAENVIHEE